MINKILGKLSRKSSSKSSSKDVANYHKSTNGEPFNTFSSVNSNSFRYEVPVNDYKSQGSSDSFVYSGSNEFSPPRNSNGTNAPMNLKKLGAMDVEKVETTGGLCYEALPSFREVPSSEKVSLFMRKLNMCCVVFDFNDPKKNLKEKDVKRRTLLELVEFVTTANLRFTEVVMQEITKMVSANLFRTLPVISYDNSILSNTYDPEVDEPMMDPSWSHLQIVYEFLLRFFSSSEMDAKLAKRYVDHSFVLRLLDLFDSEDHREREYLKTFLHRVYGKFMVHRPFIREAINNILYCFIFETEEHNGIAELLEIMGSIINGFALPLKEEHKLFLVRALIPLHKPKCEPLYHQQLAYCITQFVEKDFKLADTVIRGLLKYWPITNSSKEIMFLCELEEVLEGTHAAEFQCCMVPLFHQIGRCVNSLHFQVAERALFLWNNDQIRNLILQNRSVILPIILPSLERNSRGHWNQAVQSLSFSVKKVFSDADEELFEECLLKLQEDEIKEVEVHEKRQLRWEQLEYVAASNAVSNQAVLVRDVASSVVITKS